VGTARPARAGDFRRLGELWEAAAAELATMRGGGLLLAKRGHPGWAGGPVRGDSTTQARGHESLDSPESPEATLGAQAESPQLIVVGELSGRVVGFASCRTVELEGSPVEGQRIGSIEDLYVEPAARGEGVGRAMATVLVQWCVSRGCKGVDAPALPGSRIAKSFFEAEGFTARLLVMHHGLRPQEPEMQSGRQV